MSTLSGIASKGEKGKSKYQSLDINNLYKGESLEPSQQKSTVPRCKHGMQSLGKVPSTRRPPINLPSLKAENSGSEPAVSLVPTGGAGWGNKPGENPSPTPTQPTVTTSSNSIQSNTTTQVQATPSSGALPTQSATLKSGLDQTPAPTTHATTGDKSWSSIMAGEGGAHPPSFLAHQSPLFHQEFPKLSSGEAQSTPPNQKTGTDTQYGPGPSLRPQTEGSWIQGGGRPQTGAVSGASGSQGASLVQGPLSHHPSGIDPAGGRSNLGPHPPPGVAMGPGGPGLGIPTNGPPMHGPPLHLPPGTSPQFRSMAAPFMYRTNFSAPPGPFPPSFQANLGPPRQRFPGNYLSEGRFVGRPVDGEEILTRPIIKEEELNHMDDIARDTSWARPDEIDYNEKIVFSDTEDSTQDDDGQGRRDDKNDRKSRDTRETSENDKDRNRDDKYRVRDRDRDRRQDDRLDKRGFETSSRSRQAPSYFKLNYPQPLRPQVTVQRDRESDEEMSKERRRFQVEVEAVVERAKLRKEEEEKRHEETKRAAAKKLQMLDEKLGKSQNNEAKDREDNTAPVVPLPNWADKNRQIDGDRDRSRSGEAVDDKSRHESDSRQLDRSSVPSLRSERDNRSRPSLLSDDRSKREYDDKDGKMSIGHRTDRSRPDDRDRERSRPSGESQGYTRHYQNLPPRFLKHHAERNQVAVSSNSNYLRSTGSPQPPGSGSGFDLHWSHPNNSFMSQSGPPSNINRMPPRRFNSESSESNTEKSRNERESEEWEYDRYKTNRERSYGKHPSPYFDVDHSRRFADRNDRRDIDLERNADDNWERDRNRDLGSRERDGERDRDRERERERHSDERNKSDITYEEEREWRRIKERKSEERDELDEDGDKELGRKEERRVERPQRPDSRDSRTSRESRNSRDSVREEKHEMDQKNSSLNRGFSSSIGEPHFKEEKKKTNERREEKDKKEHGSHGKYADEYPFSFPNKSRHRFNYQRHIPGPPITREKLEASEKNDTKRNLTQLKRFTEAKRPSEEKEIWDNHGSKERSSNELWTEAVPDDESQDFEKQSTLAEEKNKSTLPEKKETGKIDNETVKQESQEKINKIEAKEDKENKLEKHDEEKEKREKSTKSRGNRGRSESGRNRQGWSVPGFRSNHGSRGDRRRRDSGRMSGRSRYSNREWNPASETEGSGDEVSASTESGKEDKKLSVGRRSKSRSHFKKAEKEERNKETKKSDSGENKSSFLNSAGPRFDRKSEFLGGSNREGFAPSGQPSRRGRGSIRIRGGISHRMDGYGPPPAKSPFSHQEEKKPGSEKANEPSSEEKATFEDDKSKHKVPGAPSTGTLGSRTSTSGGKTSQIPPRMQKKSETEQREPSRNKSNRGSRNHANKAVLDLGDDAWETTSENSDEERKHENRGGRKNYQRRGTYGRGEGSSVSGGSSRPARGGPRPSSISDKKFGRESHGSKSGGLGTTNERISKSSSAAGKVELSGSKEETKLIDSNAVSHSEASKTAGEERASEANRPDFEEGRIKKKESKDGSKSERRSGRDRDRERRNKSSKEPAGSHLQQQVASTSASAPQPLMSQVVAPPPPPTIKNYERLSNLPPRFAKQRRIQKQQAGEVGDFAKTMNMFSVKEGGVGSTSVNAWEKPLRSASPVKSTSIQMQVNSSESLQSDNSSQRSSPHVSRDTVDKSLLDGSSPPVNTIIFENTNFKSTPNDIVLKNQFNNHVKQQRLEKGERKITEEPEDMLGFSTGKTEMNTSASNKDLKTTEPPIIYGKSEDTGDMKLDFQFETELSQLTDDKATKGMRDLTRSIQQSNMSPSTADLNFKIASVKKVWESMHTVAEHSEDGNNVSTFSPNFSPDSTMDPSTYGKAVDGSVVVPDDSGEVVYNAVPQMPVNVNYSASKTDVSSTTSNVCKVKPQQQTVLTSGHSPIGHSGQSPLSHGGPISPPPYSTAQPSQFNYQQTSIGGTAAQFGGMSAIPSPPTVLYNSSTQLPPAYQTFQIDGTQVLSSQAARSQFSQFPPYGLSQGLGQTSAFSQQSVYLHQTAPPTATPDLYQSSLSQYRLQPAAGPFGQSQLNNNPNTVLISSTANSLMSATVKPSTQPIGTIGTKGATPFQQNPLPSQHSQLFIPYDPVQLGVNQSYLPNSQIVQRGAPVQPSASSFYSGSAGAQAGFYQAPASTLTQQGPGAPQLHQAAGYSLQGFNSQSSATAVGLQGFGSQMGAQQYRTPGSVAPTTYLKSAVAHHHQTALNLAQKSSTTSSQQDVLDSVFSSAPQIPSPKPRPSKQISQQQSQQSPTQQTNNKFGSYPSVAQSSSQLQQAGAQRVSQSSVSVPNVRSSGNSPRYPNPIQRPVSYQHNSSRYRPQQPRPSSGVKPYFGSQDGNLKLEENGDLKPDDSAPINCDSKIADPPPQSKADGAEDDAAKD